MRGGPGLWVFDGLFQSVHEISGGLLNGLAVGKEFDGVHTPLATLAARHEEGGFLHAFGDFTLVDARVLAGLAEEAQKGIVLRGKNGLRNGGSSSPAQKVQAKGA